MVKYFQCRNCDAEIFDDDRVRHHYENHAQVPFEEKFFKFLYHSYPIKTITCQICHGIIEAKTAEFEQSFVKHWKTFHPDRERRHLFLNNKAVVSIGIECPKCLKYVEQNRFRNNPNCPHGLTINIKIDSEQNVQHEAQKRPTSPTKPSKAKKPKQSDNVATSSTSSNSSLASSDTCIKCEICGEKIHMSTMEQHIQEEHLMDIFVVDSDDEMNRKDSLKIKSEQINDAPNQVSEIASSKSMKQTNSNEDDDSTEFYQIRVSKSEMEKFLLANRIYPKGGDFYLKDS